MITVYFLLFIYKLFQRWKKIFKDRLPALNYGLNVLRIKTDDQEKIVIIKTDFKQQKVPIKSRKLKFLFKWFFLILHFPTYSPFFTFFLIPMHPAKLVRGLVGQTGQPKLKTKLD